jgi:uncharacterized membrane protein
VDPNLQEWLHVLLRWIHVIAAIMWIGDSLLFVWIDSHLQKDPEERPDVAGVTWLIHGGGYYTLEKRLLEPGKLPPRLRWFWLEATTTWVSGFLLLVVVYYFSAGTFMVESGGSLSASAAVHLSLGLLVLGWLVYDGLWRTPLRHRPVLAVPLSFALFLALVYELTHLFSGRAAYLQAGAMLATLMAGNVWVHILPPQRKMLRLAREGRPVDLTLGQHAKTRSTHNTYLTFPVIFLMISNHFPQIYGAPLNWLLLGLLFVLGAGVRHVMVVGLRLAWWAAAAAAVSAVFLVVLTLPPAPAPAQAASGSPPVKFAEVRQIIWQRCTGCHSSVPTQPGIAAPPKGLELDTPGQIQAAAARIKLQAVTSKVMPLGNLTGMTDQERELLGRWVDSGAPLK